MFKRKTKKVALTEKLSRFCTHTVALFEIQTQTRRARTCPSEQVSEGDHLSRDIDVTTAPLAQHYAAKSASTSTLFS